MPGYGPSTFVRDLVRSRVALAAQATAVVARGQLGGFDRATGKFGGLTNATTVYSGPVRIQSVSGSGTADIGGTEVSQRDTIISIPMSAPIPHRDDIVIVGVDDLADATQDHQVYRVLGADGGGLLGAVRHLSCVTWGPSRNWGSGT
jgi:hypothetical protein